MTGEELHNGLARYVQTADPMLLVGSWVKLGQVWQEAFEYIAYSFTRPGNPVPGNPPSRNYAQLLQKYGRHAPNCPTSAPCTCGFAEIEKEWNPAA